MKASWSRDAIAARILDGDILIIYNDTLLNIPQNWLNRHPGGSLALLHFVGRDASDEIDAYHSHQTHTLIKRFSIGTIQKDDNGCWQPLVPPIASGWVRTLSHDGNHVWFNEATPISNGASEILLVKRSDDAQTAPSLASLTPPPVDLSLKVQAQHSAAYKALHKRIIDAGLYQTPYFTGYGPEVLRYILLASISTYTYTHGWLMTSAVFLGLLWHQLVFIVHDLGHMGVTHDWAIDRVIAIFIADFIGGLSVGWWVDNHNVHHLVTNHPSHDPDIEYIPFLAISTVFCKSLYSSYYKRIFPFDRAAAFLISFQHKLFYILLAFGRFNLYGLSYGHLFRKYFDDKRARGGAWAWRLEIIGILFFWSWFGSVLYGCGSWQKALAYVIVSHVVTSPLHVQIVLSHFSMSTADLGPIESFPHRQLRTTTDVICPPELSFLHGGLQLQVTHHLFPRLPRHHLRKASMLVKEFAKQQGLVYAEFGFVEGNAEVLSTLKGVAEQVKILGKVAEGEVQAAMAGVVPEKAY